VPSRGEVWLVDLGLAQKARPALILNRAFKESDRALIRIRNPLTQAHSHQSSLYR